MKIKVVSDLHLEFSDFDITNDECADMLILGGDILIAEDLHDHPEIVNTEEQITIAKGTGLGRRQDSARRYRDFLQRCSSRFAHVIYIAGNHEFYNGKWNAGLDYLREEIAKYSNVHFLECGTVVIDDVTFVGGTLWTDMNRSDPMTMAMVQQMMNDFRIIRHDGEGYRRITPSDIVARHKQTLDYFKTEVEKDPSKKYVVVGHHSPSYLSVHDRYKNEKHINGAYHSDLSEFILDHPQVKLWTHGHTHYAFDYMLGSTRIVCNPRGYQTSSYSEDTGWNPNMIIEV